MTPLAENPALRLRARVEALQLPGMLRWDASGSALLVSDAPRRSPGAADALRAIADGSIALRRGLAYIDLTPDGYRALACSTFQAQGVLSPEWQNEQRLLSGILSRSPVGTEGAVDVPLLRRAMRVLAQGEEEAIRMFLAGLRQADAAALRTGESYTCHACAALCAHWLFTARRIGMLSARHTSIPWDQAIGAGRRSGPAGEMRAETLDNAKL